MPITLRGVLRRFRRDRSGLAAIEFAFIAPIMVTFLLGATELSNGMVADRKVTQVVSTLADLVSQGTQISNAGMSNVFDCGATIMSPLPITTLGMRVTSVVADAGNVARVAWSDGRSMSARAINSVVSVPAGMLTPGGSLIYAEIQYTFTSPFGEFLVGGVTMTDGFYLRPRRSLTVARVP